MKLIRCILYMVFFMILLCGCSASHMQLEEGIHCFQVQDYRQAFIHLMPEAEKGQPDAQYAVGYMYYYGQGVIEDRKKAFHWIRCAANAGQKDAIIAMDLLVRPTLQGRRFHDQGH